MQPETMNKEKNIIFQIRAAYNPQTIHTLEMIFVGSVITVNIKKNAWSNTKRTWAKTKPLHYVFTGGQP